MPVGAEGQRNTEEMRSQSPVQVGIPLDARALQESFQNAHANFDFTPDYMQHSNRFNLVILFLRRCKAKIVTDAEIQLTGTVPNWYSVPLLVHVTCKTQ